MVLFGENDHIAGTKMVVFPSILAEYSKLFLWILIIVKLEMLVIWHIGSYLKSFSSIQYTPFHVLNSSSFGILRSR